MKRFLLLLFSVFLVLPTIVMAQQDDDLCFETTVCDFGAVVREKAIHSYVFRFENRSKEPVVLLGVQTSCSCLKTEYSRRPLQYGDKGEITVHLEALKVDEGVFHRVIKVQTNRGLHLLAVKGQSLSPEENK